MSNHLKYLLLPLMLLLPFFRLHAKVAVVRASDSLAASERSYAASLARHIARWYDASGVDVQLAPDSEMASALNGSRVAVLVCMMCPSQHQLSLLRSFVRGGGKLIVFYSSSPALASLMEVRPLRYMKCDSGTRWAEMRFSDARPAGCPVSISQSSPNLFLMEPIPGKSSVVAWWYTRDGQPTEEAAWLKSRHGYWMTHVLFADGDTEQKTRMLMAMTAEFEPGIWADATAKSLKRGKARRDEITELAIPAADSGNRLVRRRMNAMSNHIARVDALIGEGRGYDAWLAARSADATAVEVYGMLQDCRRSEIRAVWERTGLGLYPGDWGRTMSLLKYAGVTDVFVNVAGAAYAHYASSILPRSRLFGEYGDQLAACCDAAQRAGIRVHAWVVCFSLEGATSSRTEIFRSRGWTLTGDGSAQYKWLDPSVPAVREYLVGAISEIVSRYPVSGIHVDFVRYPDVASAYGAESLARFENAEGGRIKDLQSRVKRGALRQSFFRWRADQLTSFVRQSRREIRKAGGGKLFTAAVFGKYPSCYESVGQDWEAWIDTGFVDYAVPMNYTEDGQVFANLLASQSRTRSRLMAVLPGIGVTAAESRLNAMQVIDQINAVRRSGFPGFALFDLDTALMQEILPVLCLGITKPEASPRRR